MVFCNGKEMYSVSKLVFGWLTECGWNSKKLVVGGWIYDLTLAGGD
ncbi:MAG: hypothetical protein KAR13_12060 [Desulfobulbaceae bacterium]|nr:hypothetical protein [Desulfobulbaceae bacterium]MCK5544622.1 hypothetical protein [Desulfobulbaceae bacterium]